MRSCGEWPQSRNCFGGDGIVKVLIVDDSPDALAVAKARLAKEDLDIMFADG